MKITGEKIFKTIFTIIILGPMLFAILGSCAFTAYRYYTGYQISQAVKEDEKEMDKKGIKYKRLIIKDGKLEQRWAE